MKREYQIRRNERGRMIRHTINEAGKISEDILFAFIYGDLSEQCKLENRKHTCHD
jgi:hypothetical protein